MTRTPARLLLLSLLVIGALTFSGCEAHDVLGFARNSEWVGVITKDGLFTVSRNGANVHFITRDINRHYTPVFASNGERIVFVTRFGQIKAVPTIGGEETVITRVLATVDRGLLLGLPSGDVLFIDASRREGSRFLVVIDPITTETQAQIEGIGHVFVTDQAVQPRPGTDDAEWYAPFTEPQQLKIVLQSVDAPELLFLYTAGVTGLEIEDIDLRELSPEDQALIDSRVPTDLRSGTLTSDGLRLVLRTQSGGTRGEPVTYSLWGMDLTSNATPVAFVTGAVLPPQYRLSPDGHRIAFEAPGGLLGMYDFDTGVVETLAVDAWDPDWR